MCRNADQCLMFETKLKNRTNYCAHTVSHRSYISLPNVLFLCFFCHLFFFFLWIYFEILISGNHLTYYFIDSDYRFESCCFALFTIIYLLKCRLFFFSSTRSSPWIIQCEFVIQLNSVLTTESTTRNERKKWRIESNQHLNYKT